MTKTEKARETRRVLIAARRLIRKGWCKGAVARAKGGDMVDAGSPRAVRWCLMGALLRVAPGAGWRQCALLHNAIGCESLAGWNDARRTKAPVLAALDRMIKSLGVK
jgi:hypothetical protein